MPEPLDALGPILELMTWVGFIPGIPLLIAGWIRAKRRCQWTTTNAEVFEAGGHLGLGWSDTTGAPHLSLRESDEIRGMKPGQEITIHYDLCHPLRWSLQPFRHEDPVLIIGWIFVALGIVCALAGFILMML